MTTRLPAARFAAAVLAVALLGGCGDDESDLERAQANVTLKEKAVTDAQAEADDAVAAFCGDAKDYILALDRYGDVLTSTAPTVGDVRDAGSDLEEPADDVSAAAEAAIDARDALIEANAELKAARTDLAAVEKTASPSPSPSPSASDEPKVKATPHPLPGDKAVNRVKQAQDELDATMAGIGEQTPLVQASEQFNAAAVALEMSWLKLLSASGCLTDDQQVQGEAAVSEYTTILQTSLAEAGYYAGEIDGVYGAETTQAVEDLQQVHGLPVTGTLDKASADALAADLQEQGGLAADEAIASTAALQQTLSLVGYWDGPVDGAWTTELTDALEAFQTDLGVEPTGVVDAATVAAFEAAIAAAQEPEPTPSETPSEVPSDEPTASESADD